MRSPSCRAIDRHRAIAVISNSLAEQHADWSDALPTEDGHLPSSTPSIKRANSGRSPQNATACGFGDPVALRKHFYANLGKSPLAYRRAHHAPKSLPAQ
ncbi:hypothetical protein [Amycolatopsis echigonensis]|uniref:hypothetical protein n=1 Tax=Amycolatopsis echigonensis TaxID=2576905 RepID=UPI001C7E5A37|nr:hypothetical protein [Amycolatopsis echigonensis]